MRYRVAVREFWFGAAMHAAGDIIEADNTQEVLTNVALGRLVELKRNDTARIESAVVDLDNMLNQPTPMHPVQQAIADRLNEATQPPPKRGPGRPRKYPRRDQ